MAYFKIKRLTKDSVVYLNEKGKQEQLPEVLTLSEVSFKKKFNFYKSLEKLGKISIEKLSNISLEPKKEEVKETPKEEKKEEPKKK